MSAIALDELSVNMFLTNGPYFNFKNTDDLFSTAKHLGTPFEMEMFSSINGAYRYGYITIFDDGGIREALPLTGNEIISIMYRNPFNETLSKSLGSSLPSDFTSNPMIVHFNIYDIEEIPYYGNSDESRRFTTKLLKLHLIESPFFLLYNSTLWQKAYGSPSSKVKINEIFEKHLIDDLKIYNKANKYNIVELNINKMSTEMNFIIPSWKSQQTFSYLLDFCKDDQGFGNVKFFNTTNRKTSNIIVNLKSLNNMMQNPTYREFSLLNESPLMDLKKDPGKINNRTLNEILKYKFVYYDLSSVTSGLGGGYMLNFDYKNSQYYTLYDTYEESNKKKENSYFSNFGLWRDEISNENSRQYFISEFPKNVAKKYLNNKITKNKHQIKCEIVTYLDETIQVGDKILIAFISGMTELQRDKQNHLFDEHMTDEWLVEEINDTYKEGKCIRKMTIIKDSFFNLYGTETNSNSSKLPIPKVNVVLRT